MSRDLLRQSGLHIFQLSTFTFSRNSFLQNSQSIDECLLQIDDYDSLWVFTQCPQISVACPCESDDYNLLQVFTLHFPSEYSVPRVLDLVPHVHFKSNDPGPLRDFGLWESQLLYALFCPELFHPEYTID
jgi:hypothetical protein